MQRSTAHALKPCETSQHVRAVGYTQLAAFALGALMHCGPPRAAQPTQAELISLQPRGQRIGQVGPQGVTLAEVEDFARTHNAPSASAAWELFSRDRLLALHALTRNNVSAAANGEFAQRAMIQRLLQIEIEQRFTRQNIAPEAMVLAQKTRGFALRHGPINGVIHAVARCRPTDSASSCAQAEQTAQAVHAALAAATDRSTEAAVRAVIATVPGASTCQVELVSGFDETGSDGTAGGFDPTFARAAAALPEVGALSAVTRTPFGFHVIVLLRRDPALQADPAVVAAEVEREALTFSRTRAMRAYLDQLRQRYHVRMIDTSTGTAEGVRP